MRREGYYVEGKFFGSHRAQAEGRARHLSEQYGRGVDVLRWQDGHAERVITLYVASTCDLSLAIGL